MACSNHRVRFSLSSLLVLGALGLQASCSERYADAVILDPDVADAGPIPPGPAYDARDSGSTQGSTNISDRGLADLCQPCEYSSQCGSDNDFCLQLPWLGGQYCGMDCNHDSDCPNGYECTNLQFTSDVEQCTPVSGSCDNPDAGQVFDPPTDSQARDYALGVINDLRHERDLQPLELSNCLDDIADKAVADLENEGIYNSMFYNECYDVIPDCACNWQQESQAWVLMKDRTWQEAVAHPFLQAAANDPHSEFFTPIIDDAWQRVGIAVRLNPDYALISVEFAP